MAIATVEPLRRLRAGHATSARIELAGGARTTVHVACHATADYEPQVAVLRGQARLEAWCAAHGVSEALVGGFFVRPHGLPLGEVRTRGVARRYAPFDPPWDSARACVHVRGGVPGIAHRFELPDAPAGDLLQAGPLLVRDGAAVYRRSEDLEGFSAGEHQFDSDITDGRYPRAAFGLADGRMLAVACDGRSHQDAGMTLEELAALMVALGCTSALNLDGGGSTSLVSGGRLLNRPRAAWERPEAGGRPISTALLFVPRT